MTNQNTTTIENYDIDLTEEDGVLYEDPLAGVVLKDEPCPPGQNREQAIREQEEIAGMDHMPTDREATLLRMLRNALDRADAGLCDLDGVNGGDRMRWQGKEEATELAQLGVSFDEIAEAVGVQPTRISQLFTNHDERVQQFLTAERHVRSGDWDRTMKGVMKVSGLPRASLQLFLANIGVKTTAAKNRGRGGGWKYSPEQYEAIRKMRQQNGWSYALIAKHMAMDPSSVFRICRRNGWTEVLGGDA